MKEIKFKNNNMDDEDDSIEQESQKLMNNIRKKVEVIDGNIG